MIVTPVPGTDRNNLLQALRHLHTMVTNDRGAGGTAEEAHTRYLAWVAEAVRMLRRSITSSNLDTLVLTRRSWVLQGMPSDVVRVSRNLLETELSERIDDFEAAVTDFDEQIRRWQNPGRVVVADTSFYIHHPDKLEDLDLREVLELRDTPVYLALPIVVIDELDSLKQSKQPQTRWRARHTLAILDTVLRDPSQAAQLTGEDFSGLAQGEIPRGRVSVQILFDPPGHTRLPITDDEIIDRALAVQCLTGREVTLITYDTGQSTRARAAGLKSCKLQLPTEPEPGTS